MASKYCAMRTSALCKYSLVRDMPLTLTLVVIRSIPPVLFLISYNVLNNSIHFFAVRIASNRFTEV